MTEELEKEAEKWLRKFLLCNDCKRKCHCIELNAYCEEQVLKAYISSAEPREKRIAELETQIEKMKKYIKACWVEENLNDYSSYITNTSDEFRDLVKELNDEVRNGR